MLSLGNKLQTALATVKPPIPESNMPMGPKVEFGLIKALA